MDGFKNLLNSAEIAENIILEEANNKKAVVESYHGSYWKVAYGDKLHQVEKLSDLDFINENNEYIKPERGLTGVLKFVNGSFKMVCENNKSSSVNFKKGDKVKFHNRNNESHGNGVKILSEPNENGIVSGEWLSGPSKGEQNLIHVSNLKHYVKEETLDEDMYNGSQSTLNQYLRLKGISYGKYKNAPQHEKDAYHAEIKHLVNKGLMKEDNEQLDEISKEKLKSYKKLNENYPLYHSQYTYAINSAFDYHKNNGLNVDDDTKFKHIGVGPRKPAEGETVTHNIPAKDKNNKNHIIHIQVYNKGGNKPYELNTYSTKLNESTLYENAFKKNYEKALEQLSDDELYHEARQAAIITKSSKGQDTWRDNACAEESKRRGKPEIHAKAVNSVGAI